MISIRPAIATDVKAMISLIKELALYEKAPEQVINTEDEMLKDGFGEYPLFNAFIAEKENKIIGTAICYLAYSTWKGRYIYLDDLIVTETERKTGAGTLLFEAVFNYAKSINSNQLRWHVLDWNEPAISFYKKYPCTFDEEWITCKIEKENL
ncbi:N-acetyltransferase [Bacteroidota bacterium]|nr:N-acetyltransferase [Bacteroidota bacterium]